MKTVIPLLLSLGLLSPTAFSNQQSLTSKINNKSVVTRSLRNATSNDKDEGWQILTDALALKPVTTSEFLEITDTGDARTIKLLTDFTAGSEDTHLDIAAGKNIILDLNGYVINRNLDPYPTSYTDSTIDSAIYIDKIDDINLTINDSNPSAKHDGYLDTKGLWRYDPDGTYVLGEGEIEKDLNGGIITGSSRDGIYCNTSFYSSASNNRFITLNSGSIAGNAGTSYAAAGVVLDHDITFTMNGGSIFGNYNSGNSGGVAVMNGCIFYMTGGTISGNVSKHRGAGVIINGTQKPAEMLMTGGIISKNKTLGANAFTSGGIAIDTGSLTLGGNAVIRNNTYIDQEDGNKEKIGNVSAYQNSKDYKISIAEGDNAPRDGMCVGVDLQKMIVIDEEENLVKYERIPGRFTDIDDKLMESYTKYFSSDSPDYYVAYNSDGYYFELKEAEAGEKLIQISPNDNGLIYTDKQAATVGDEVTLTVIPDAEYEFVEGSLEVNGSSEGITKTGDNTYKFIMPNANAVVTAEFKATLSSISIKSSPDKVQYTYGEDLDLTGAVITATYSDGSTEDVSVTSDMVSGYDKNKLGEQILTVTYEGLTTTFTVNVSDYITGISIQADSAKTDYKYGEELDLSGLKLKVGTASGSFDTIDVTSDMVSGYDKNKEGEQTITITYAGFTTSYTVTVTKAGLSGGAIAGIVIGSLFGLLIIVFAVLYILWKRKNFNVPFLCKVLTPAFRFVTKLLFKTKLNNVEAKDCEDRLMEEEDYLKALKDKSLMESKK